MENKGFILIGILAFGIGALLAFIFKVDAENVTILSVAAIAGLLSYMTIFLTEENKNNENILNEINAATWFYLKSVEEYTYSIMMKLISLEEIREDGEAIDVMAARKKEEDHEDLLKKIGEWKEATKKHIDNKEIYLQQKVRCTSKGEEVIDLIAMYRIVYEESYENALDEMKNEISTLNSFIGLYSKMNNLYAEKKLLDLEEFVMTNIESGMINIRNSLINLKAINEAVVFEKKKRVFVYILIIVFVCLGYLVSESYRVDLI